MKTISKLASGLALVAISGAAAAGGTGIAQTKHNLGSGNQTGGNFTNATTEICIFCHTPHGGDQSAAAPLWNRKFSSTTVYTRYSSLNTTSFDATEAPIGSVSIACLSCHDGTQAMDAVLNSPGGGTGYTGANQSTSSFGQDAYGDATGGVTGGLAGGGGWNEQNMMQNMTGANNGNTGDLIYLGTDLRNDHPVSMQYGGGGMSATDTAGTSMNDPDYAPGGSTAGAWGNNGAIGGTGVVNTRVLSNANALRVWYVDTNGTVGQTKEDMPLYTRDIGGGGGNEPFVECATCHDPHSNNQVFLRSPTGNAGSAVCLACHKK